MSTGLHWFRRPGDGSPGTLNACYHALDRHVVAGRADDLASTWSGRPQTFAELLSEVGALAGALRALGVEPGTPVPLQADADQPGALLLLALLRLGAVPILDDADPPEGSAEAPVVVRARVGGLEPVEGRTILVPRPDDVPAGRDDVLPVGLLLTAGRDDPAGCADVAGDAALWRSNGRAAGREESAGPGAAEHLAHLVGSGPQAAGEWPDVVLGPLVRGEPLRAH